MPVTAQAVRLGLANVTLPGRFQIVPGEPVLVLDVAHNPHAAATLAINLDQMGFHPRTFAVFGAMADKDLRGVIDAMKPLVDAWLPCDLATPRAATAQLLADQVRDACRPNEVDVSTFASPSLALRAAIGRADPADRIVVFGSFYTVGGVLKDGLPRTGARHGA
jgi:dihydrofolate synthase/folylpolyglutamate synthase